MPIHSSYAWTRFWIPRGSKPQIHNGFLIDPEQEYGRLLQEDILDLTTNDLPNCAVLLGEPGLGKSSEVQSYRNSQEEALEASDQILYKDLRSYSSDTRFSREVFESQPFLAWRRGDCSLEIILDSLDECMLHLKTVAQVLVDGLREERSTENLRLRIVCRTATWPTFLKRELACLWTDDSYQELELLPLRRCDVELAAKQEGLDPSDFLTRVKARNLTPFASRPLTLSMLLQSKGQFPENEIDLRLAYSLHLCRDSNSRLTSGSSKLSADERLAIGERLAALTIFGRRRGFSTEDPPDDNGQLLQIRELIGRDETFGPQEITVSVDRDAILETLDTGLFSGGELDSSLTWSHWSYAEFLAARYLLRRRLPLSQLIHLFSSPLSIDSSRSLIIPQLYETAAWLAAMNSRFRDWVLESDPKVLLEHAPDSALKDPAVRQELVESLLRLTDEGKMTDASFSQSHYQNLEHAGLADQLRPYICDVGKGGIVRRMAIQMAEACKVRDLQDDLLELALDPGQDYERRKNATSALVALGDDSTKTRLRELLNDPKDEDDGLKGYALRALWPQHLSIDELFENITPPKSLLLRGGSYRRFLEYEIEFSPKDLPMALTWISKVLGETEVPRAFDFLVKRTLAKSWDHLKNEKTLKSLAKIVATRLPQLSSLVEFSNFSEKELWADPKRSQRLLTEVVHEMALALQATGTTNHTKGSRLGNETLVRPLELAWLVDELRDSKDSYSESIWAQLVWRAFQKGCEQDTNRLELLWKAKEHSDTTQRILGHHFEAVGLGSEEAEELRLQNEFSTSFMAEEEPPLRPNMVEFMEDYLDRFAEGDTDAWWRMTEELSITRWEEPYYWPSPLEPNLTSLPAWAVLPESTRQRILSAAPSYLGQNNPRVDWLGQNRCDSPAVAGYRALRLLQSEARSLFDQIPGEVWSQWMRVVLEFPENVGITDDDSVLSLVAKAHRVSPETFREAVIDVIESRNTKVPTRNEEEAACRDLFLKLHNIRDQALDDKVLQKAGDPNLKPEIQVTLIHHLIRRPGLAGDARRVALDCFLGSDPERADLCGALLIAFGGNEGWAAVLQSLSEDEDRGSSLIYRFCSPWRVPLSISRHDLNSISNVKEEFLQEMYLWLTLHFPHRDDPADSGKIGPRTDIANFRDGVLRHLVRRGTACAVSAIANIALSLPNLQFCFHLEDAQASALEASWEGHSPHELMQMFRDADRRFVENERQLLEVIKASLERYQTKLLGEIPKAEELWNEKPRRPKSENAISDSIAGFLNDDLAKTGVIVNREVRIRRGELTDIHIVALGPLSKTGEPTHQSEVIIEVKGCWHPDLKTAMQNQLRDRYLRENQCSTGLYLVVWFACEAWDETDYKKKGTPTWPLEEPNQFFTSQANKLSRPGEILEAVVLDASIRTHPKKQKKERD